MDRGVSEYRMLKAQASCTECGTHSPRGEPFTNIAKWVVQSVFILPPHQTSHVSSIPLSIVYEPKLADGSLHMTHISRINSRRSNYLIRHHKQRACWHKDILPKLI